MELRGNVVVTSPGSPAHNVSSPAGGSVVASPGIPGPPGAGVQLRDAVETYADLPVLTSGDRGAAIVVQATGKLYVWSGVAWPDEASGADFRGETGRGVVNVGMSGSSLDFGMSDGSHEIVAVPAITAAAASASAAAASASAAELSKTAAAASASAASTSAGSASASASAASSSATSASSSASAANASATAADGSKAAAASSASAADASKVAAAGSASAADGSKVAASGSATAASVSASNAASSASAASASATSAASDADDAESARVAAEAASVAAFNSATSAGDSATVASTKAGEASASAISASGSAGAASGSKSAAAASASAAAGSASTAAADALAAASSRSNAATSETNAYQSALAAAQSAEDAQAIVDDGVADATATVKGGVLLPGGVDGELGGTFDHPTVRGWSNKADLVGGKVPVSQIPALATTESFVVASESERLALTCETGDIAVQTGNPGRGTYILRGSNPASAGDWVFMIPPDAAVSSVNGYTGIVVLGKSDVGLGNVSNTSDAAKPISTAAQAALDAKAPTSRTVSAGTGLSGGGDLSANRTLSVQYGTTAGTACQGSDPRLSDPRTPINGSVTQAKLAPNSGFFDRVSLATAMQPGFTFGAGNWIIVNDSDPDPGNHYFMYAAYGALQGDTPEGLSTSGRMSPIILGIDDGITLGDRNVISLLDGGVSASKIASGVLPMDMSMVCFGKDTTRAVGVGDNPFGIKLQRGVVIKSFTARALTADASGDMTVVLRKNGVAISGATVTVSSGSQVSGGTTSGLLATLAEGDVLTAAVTAVGTTPGKGLVVDIKAAVY